MQALNSIGLLHSVTAVVDTIAVGSHWIRLDWITFIEDAPQRDRCGVCSVPCYCYCCYAQDFVSFSLVTSTFSYAQLLLLPLLLRVCLLGKLLLRWI